MDSAIGGLEIIESNCRLGPRIVAAIRLDKYKMWWYTEARRLEYCRVKRIWRAAHAMSDPNCCPYDDCLSALGPGEGRMCSVCKAQRYHHMCALHPAWADSEFADGHEVGFEIQH